MHTVGKARPHVQRYIRYRTCSTALLRAYWYVVKLYRGHTECSMGLKIPPVQVHARTSPDPPLREPHVKRTDWGISSGALRDEADPPLALHIGQIKGKIFAGSLRSPEGLYSFGVQPRQIEGYIVVTNAHAHKCKDFTAN